MTKTLKLWELATNNLVQGFVSKHFGRTASWDWIGGVVGEVVDCCDYFFDLNDIANFERYGYNSEDMLGYCDHRLDAQTNNPTSPIICIRDWRELKNANFAKTKSKKTTCERTGSPTRGVKGKTDTMKAKITKRPNKGK